MLELMDLETVRARGLQDGEQHLPRVAHPLLRARATPRTSARGPPIRVNASTVSARAARRTPTRAASSSSSWTSACASRACGRWSTACGAAACARPSRRAAPSSRGDQAARHHKSQSTSARPSTFKASTRARARRTRGRRAARPPRRPRAATGGRGTCASSPEYHAAPVVVTPEEAGLPRRARQCPHLGSASRSRFSRSGSRRACRSSRTGSLAGSSPGLAASPYEVQSGRCTITACRERRQECGGGIDAARREKESRGELEEEEERRGETECPGFTHERAFASHPGAREVRNPSRRQIRRHPRAHTAPTPRNRCSLARG